MLWIRWIQIQNIQNTADLEHLEHWFQLMGLAFKNAFLSSLVKLRWIYLRQEFQFCFFYMSVKEEEHGSMQKPFQQRKIQSSSHVVIAITLQQQQFCSCGNFSQFIFLRFFLCIFLLLPFLRNHAASATVQSQVAPTCRLKKFALCNRQQCYNFAILQQQQL